MRDYSRRGHKRAEGCVTAVTGPVSYDVDGDVDAQKIEIKTRYTELLQTELKEVLRRESKTLRSASPSPPTEGASQRAYNRELKNA
ncbi:hypothetical protein EVAR_66373_1 [Eumeta japonica]|uniref:Uncharacterized protein n=1 Tax=Eumeta variegata TaxID=151549 RepID=A0A4C1ZLE1_EUMVA|nr:hypothetical protein EVAR_66373_1 [Eumeta japonica]